MNKTKIFFTTLLIVGGLFGVLGLLTTVSAQATQGEEIVKQLQAGAGDDGANLPAPRDPRIVAGGIIRSALGLLGILFVCLIIYAGFLWMTAGGNDENITQAKSYIFNGVIGLIIILSAYMITIYAFKVATAPYGLGGNCTKNADCGKDRKCNLYGKCVDKMWCQSDRDCGKTQTCINSYCTTAEDLGSYFK